MNTHDHHDEPLPGEDELKALYRSLPRNEPAQATDQAVRRAAAEAVRPAQRKHMARWPLAAASAAVLVLAAGLSWRMHEQSPVLPQPVVPETMTATPPAPAAAPAEKAVEEKAAVADQAAAQAIPAQVVAENVPPPRAPARVAAKPRAAAAPPTIVMEQAAKPAPMPMPQAEAPTNLPAPPPAPAPAMQAPVAAYTAERANLAASGATMKAMTAAPVAAAPVPTAAPVADPTAANPTDTPAQEVNKIRQLFATHRENEALQRLTAFRQAHPDVALPDDLRARLPDHE